MRYLILKWNGYILNTIILTFSFSISSRSNAHLAGVGEIFDRVLIELVGKMKEMRMVRPLFDLFTASRKH